MKKPPQLLFILFFSNSIRIKQKREEKLIKEPRKKLFLRNKEIPEKITKIRII